jgi:hypothetical protein
VLALRQALLAGLVLVVAASAGAGANGPSPDAHRSPEAEHDEGYAVSVAQAMRDDRQAVVATFARRSYRPGALARLVVWSPVRRVRVGIFRAGFAPLRSRRHDRLDGARVADLGLRVRRRTVGRWRIVLRVPDVPSGLYFARLSARRGRLGYAPFVVRPRRLGSSRVAVVLPTNTWQAYNFRDVDGDGVPDTWYADASIPSVDLTRPHLDRGVPRHFRHYEAGLLRWLALTGKQPDVLSDDDLDRVSSGRRLARLYDLVVFPGHEEYVTAHVFSIVRRYRDLGGNLAFLSANNFFYRVDRRGERLFRIGRWRDLGRPAAPLIGLEYVGWSKNRFRNRPYTVVGVRRAPWLFRGTGLRNGDRFGVYGIEVDQRHRLSPRGLRVLARIPNIFGRGRSAEMAYYETGRGAKVFAAGVLNFGGSALQPAPRQMLENLWARLSRP